VAEAVDFKWYRYTADDGSFFALKVDKTWGDDADSGFAAFNAADPAITPNPSFRPRTITMQDLVSGRVTRLPVGTTTATAWTTSGYTTDRPVRGGAGTVEYTKIANNGERIRRPRTIINKPEPISA
jgi:hypothetical protein